ncbi:MAG: hypothetical protein ACJZ1R_05365 [Candidatus Neomarinimicrobiota bacterium]
MRFLILILFLSSIMLAQQGKYIRKSVSSLESVWYKPGSLSGLSFDAKTFDMFTDFYIETPRFDYNVLPSRLLQDFRREANSLDEITAEALSGVLESTVTSKIIEILNDPEIMKNRGSALKSESALQSFAATKAKSVGLTTKELATLMNSAYFYLPFISSAKKESEGAKDLSITIQGGIIWWQMKVGSDGSISVEQVLTATTEAISSIDPTAKALGQSLYNEFTFGNDTWKTTPEQYCQNDAMLAFCKNLGVKTKELDDFKLSAQIAEASGKKYGFPLGFREGVHLDDGFHIVEFEEQDGEEVAVRQGFVRVSKTGDNKKNSNNLTYATQLLGSRVSEGTIVMEHPRLGLDARVKLGLLTGLNIPKDDVPAGLFGSPNLFEEDVTSAAAVDVFFSYNLAPIIGLSQTFLDLNTTFAFPTGKINEEAFDGEVPSIAPFLLSAYLGGTKKIWFGSSNLSIFSGGGIESLNLAGKLFGEDYVYSVRSIAFKFAIDFEKLITPDVSVNLGLKYKFALPPMQLAISYAGVEDTYEGADVSNLYPDLSLSALGLNLGVNYALGELPFNLFGFLDPLKKH